MSQATVLEMAPAGLPDAAQDEDAKAGSVLKALTLLDVFRGHGPTLVVSDIARRAVVAK